jgi:ribonuclease HI
MMRVVVKAFRKKKIKTVAYVDDFLFILEKDCEKKKIQILKTFRRFGLQLNVEKSFLKPHHKIEFLGLKINSEKMLVKAPKEKIRNVRKLASYLLKRLETNQPIQKRTLARLAGMAISISQAILPTRMMLERIHKSMKTSPSWEGNIRVIQGLKEDLSWWKKEFKNWNGKSFLPMTNPITITTDASASGWGATLGKLQASGFWDMETKRASSNQRELLAVVMAIMSFKDKIRGKDIRILSDNATTVAQINLLSGRTQKLNKILRRLVNLSSELGIRLTATHLPGDQNTTADALSRVKDKSDWMLNPHLFIILDRIWGPHTIDRFASNLNKQTVRFNSLRRCPGTEAIDAFQQCWRHDINWVNPPFTLLHRVINLLKNQGLPKTTVIAPYWPAQPWWEELYRIADEILEIPNNINTFLPGFLGNLEPLKNPKWRIFAFRISGLKKRQIGIRRQKNCSCIREDHPPFKLISPLLKNACNSVNNMESHSHLILPLV